MTAPVWRPLPGEQRLLVSPAWFVLVDDHRGRAYDSGPLVVRLDRWDGRDWTPDPARAVRTPSGVVAYPGLGRRREPANAEPVLHRVRLEAPGYRVLYTPDDHLDRFAADVIGREFLAYPFDDVTPPEVTAEPEVVRLLPGVAYPYTPGTRVIAGLVRRAGSGEPLAGVLVTAEGRTDPEGLPWRERTLTGESGAFRLALRWAGESATTTPAAELFQLTAAERPGRTGRLTVRLPDERDRVHVIEISGE
ncbi:MULTISPECIES: hypothetical protein [Actinoplanes]|uniref:hypothetical protein n=1 Tax=Actinoplanes TaxID=1865 RepID=UPI000A670460|nr:MULTISPECIES: hypothetical protein [Actinoplanes]GLY05325.1 hypothetical protein Acsp01_57040 [Actinoplanes sp. NBRC 101535]